MRGVCGVPIVRVLPSLTMVSLNISSVDVFMFFILFLFLWPCGQGCGLGGCKRYFLLWGGGGLFQGRQPDAAWKQE